MAGKAIGFTILPCGHGPVKVIINFTLSLSKPMPMKFPILGRDEVKFSAQLQFHHINIPTLSYIAVSHLQKNLDAYKEHNNKCKCRHHMSSLM